jgi:hypothetical protein
VNDETLYKLPPSYTEKTRCCLNCRYARDYTMYDGDEMYCNVSGIIKDRHSRREEFRVRVHAVCDRFEEKK